MNALRSSAFHGFRVGPQCGRAAPPVATFRRPVGANNNHGLLTKNGRLQKPALPSSIFIAWASASALRRMLVPSRRPTVFSVSALPAESQR